MSRVEPLLSMVKGVFKTQLAVWQLLKTSSIGPLSLDSHLSFPQAKASHISATVSTSSAWLSECLSQTSLLYLSRGAKSSLSSGSWLGGSKAHWVACGAPLTQRPKACNPSTRSFAFPTCGKPHKSAPYVVLGSTPAKNTLAPACCLVFSLFAFPSLLLPSFHLLANMGPHLLVVPTVWSKPSLLTTGTASPW